MLQPPVRELLPVPARFRPGVRNVGLPYGRGVPPLPLLNRSHSPDDLGHCSQKRVHPVDVAGLSQRTQRRGVAHQPQPPKVVGSVLTQNPFCFSNRLSEGGGVSSTRELHPRWAGAGHAFKSRVVPCPVAELSGLRRLNTSEWVKRTPLLWRSRRCSEYESVACYGRHIPWHA